MTVTAPHKRGRAHSRPGPNRSTAALFRRMRRTGDPHAREALIRRFLPLARKLARRYHGGGEPLEDLVQVANLGLVKAVHRYDNERGVSFSSYAVPTITGELKRYFRDNTWSAHVPRGMRERALQVNTAIKRFVEKRGRTPTTSELAQQLELEEQEVLDAQVAYVAFDAVSLDAPVAGEDSDPQPRLETLGSADSGFGLAEERVTVGTALRNAAAAGAHRPAHALRRGPHSVRHRKADRRVADAGLADHQAHARAAEDHDRASRRRRGDGRLSVSA